MILTYRYRLKDGRASDRAALRAQARAVNYLWNFLCDTQRESERRWKAGASKHAAPWFTGIGFGYLTVGVSKELGIHSCTISAVNHAFASRRDKLRRCPRWRSAKHNLDWIPLDNIGQRPYLRIERGLVVFRKRRYRLWWTRDLPDDAKLKTASFNCDARGRWYLNITFETAEVRSHGSGEIGIDLGLAALATTSVGEAIPNLRHAARYAETLAKANRARNKRRVRAIHAKIANVRRDHLHKVSTRLIRANQRVVVGNVSPSKLRRTRFAKAVNDIGWTTFRTMLRYKALRHGVEYLEVNESYSSRTCSACGSIPAGSPKGMNALGIREWRCDDCGTVHDRDVNAARNILLGAERRPPKMDIAA